LNIKSLKSLVQLAENRCDFGIHRHLGIPRSTLWAHITDIEKETGIKLIIRKKQNNVLTEEGKNFLPYAQRLLKLFEEGVSHSKELHSGEPEGELIISTTLAIANSWLMPSIRSFRSSYPGIQLKVIADDYMSTSTEMVSDIIVRPMAEKDFLQRRWSVLYHLGLYASPDYLKRNGVPKKPEDLLNHSMVGYGEHIFSYFPDVDWHLKGKWPGFPKLTPRLTINSTKSIYLAAVEGIGICSGAVESQIFYKGGLRRVLPDVDGPLVHSYCCTKRDMSQKLQRNVDIFNDFFVRYLKDLGVQIYDQEE
jgi:DNA-binding transcriptional LysR family regulator